MRQRSRVRAKRGADGGEGTDIKRYVVRKGEDRDRNRDGLEMVVEARDGNEQREGSRCFCSRKT